MTEYPQISVTTDVALFTLREDLPHVLLIRRKNEPFKGDWAFPGGFLEPDEALPAGALRELREETGIDIPVEHIAPLLVAADVDRDPRGRVISHVFYGFIPHVQDPIAADDAASAEWVAIPDLLTDEEHPQLNLDLFAFDHGIILDVALSALAVIPAIEKGLAHG